MEFFQEFKPVTSQSKLHHKLYILCKIIDKNYLLSVDPFHYISLVCLLDIMLFSLGQSPLLPADRHYQPLFIQNITYLKNLLTKKFIWDCISCHFSITSLNLHNIWLHSVCLHLFNFTFVNSRLHWLK